MMTLNPAEVSLDRLLLDPNNYRFKEPGSSVPVSEVRISEPSVQNAALQRIQKDGISELKQSISENGFIQVERVVVRPYRNEENGLYVVVEGNRRTAALKLLEEDYLKGIDLNDNVKNVFQEVPVLVATDSAPEDYLAIMGIRHVGGPKEWGGYQSALLIHQLFEDSPQITAREVASRLGLTVNEVNRRYRAFEALTQMMDDEEYGDEVTPEMYPIFHEAVGQPIVREWLGWVQANRRFEDDNNRILFYSWLSEKENGPKIQSYRDVRDLRLILENEDALVALKDDDQSFVDAMAIVRSEAKSARWHPNVKAALASLNEMGQDTIQSLNGEQLSLLEQLRESSAWIIKAHSVSTEPDVNED